MELGGRFLIVCADCLNWLPTIESNPHNVVISDPDWSMEDFDWGRFLRECMRITSGGTTVLVWGASPKILGRLFSAAWQVEYQVKHIFIWYKPNGGQPTGWGVSRRWEAVVWMDNRTGRRGELTYLPDVWTIPRVTTVMREDMGHRWQKPLGLCNMLVRGFSRHGDTVIDPCCGTGSILDEAQFQGRKVRGCDISPKWAQHAQALLERIPLSRPGELF